MCFSRCTPAHHRALTFLFALALGAPAAVAAAETPATTAAEVAPAELERRIDALAQQLEKLEIGKAYVSADQSVHGLGPAASKIYRAEPGLSIGGYGEVKAAMDWADNSHTIDVHRIILYAGYKFNDKWVFNSEIEFEHIDELAVEFAYLDYLARPELNLRVGHVLVPMGLTNELHEPTTFLSVDRPEVERRIIPTTWHENGVGLFGEVSGLAYKAYLINGFDASRFGPNDDGFRGVRQNGSKAKFNQPAGVLALNYVGAPGFVAGASAVFGNADQRGANRILTGIYEGHLAGTWRGLSVRALGTYATIANADDLNAALGFTAPTDTVASAMFGYYAEVGYDVMSLIDDSSIRLTPFVRFSQLDTQADVPSGRQADPSRGRIIVTAGAAIQPIDQISFKIDYQHTAFDDDSSDDRVNLGVGFIF